MILYLGPRFTQWESGENTHCDTVSAQEYSPCPMLWPVRFGSI